MKPLIDHQIRIHMLIGISLITFFYLMFCFLHTSWTSTSSTIPRELWRRKHWKALNSAIFFSRLCLTLFPNKTHMRGNYSQLTAFSHLPSLFAMCLFFSLHWAEFLKFFDHLDDSHPNFRWYQLTVSNKTLHANIDSSFFRTKTAKAFQTPQNRQKVKAANGAV